MPEVRRPGAPGRQAHRRQGPLKLYLSLIEKFKIKEQMNVGSELPISQNRKARWRIVLPATLGAQPWEIMGQ